MKNRTVIVMLLLTAAVVPCNAGGYISPWLSAWYLGMSGSGTAGFQSPGTIIINPASGAWLNHPAAQINGGLNWADAAFLRTGSFETVATRTAAFSSISAFAVWRKKPESRFTWGLGVSSPYSIAVQWPENWDGAFLNQELFINSLFLTPSASLMIGDRLSLGLSVSAGVINLSTSKALNISGAGNVLPAEKLNGRRLGGRIQAGLVWQVSASTRVGISYQSSLLGEDIQGEASFNPPALFAEFYPDTDFRYTLPGPAELRAGLAFRVDPKWELYLDAHHTGWKALDTVSIEYETQTALLTNEKQDWNWKNTIAVRAGSVWDLGKKGKLFLGMSFDPTPVPQDRVTPQLPEGSRIAFSGGTSWQLQEHLSIEIAGGYSTTGERLGIFAPRNFGGTYQMQDISAQIGLNWQW